MSSDYARNKAALESSLTLGVVTQTDDPDVRPVVTRFTDDQVEWAAGWLAGEGFHRHCTIEQLAQQWSNMLDTESHVMTTPQRNAWTNALRELRAAMRGETP
jgi:hypothetical protein